MCKSRRKTRDSRSQHFPEKNETPQRTIQQPLYILKSLNLEPSPADTLFNFSVILHLDYWFIPLHNWKWCTLVKNRNVISFVHSRTFWKNCQTFPSLIPQAVLGTSFLLQLAPRKRKLQTVVYSGNKTMESIVYWNLTLLISSLLCSVLLFFLP